MTENGIRFMFEQLEELNVIIEKFAEKHLPPSNYNKFGVHKIDFSNGGSVTVEYCQYIGCNEYDYVEKTFSIDEVVQFNNEFM